MPEKFQGSQSVCLMVGVASLVAFSLYFGLFDSCFWRACAAAPAFQAFGLSFNVPPIFAAPGPLFFWPCVKHALSSRHSGVFFPPNGAAIGI